PSPVATVSDVPLIDGEGATATVVVTKLACASNIPAHFSLIRGGAGHQARCNWLRFVPQHGHRTDLPRRSTRLRVFILHFSQRAPCRRNRLRLAHTIHAPFWPLASSVTGPHHRRNNRSTALSTSPRNVVIVRNLSDRVHDCARAIFSGPLARDDAARAPKPEPEGSNGTVKDCSLLMVQ